MRKIFVEWTAKILKTSLNYNKKSYAWMCSCSVSMFCVINIIIYLLVIKSIDTEYIQSKIINYSIVRKILNLYKKTSMTFIVIEFSFILYIHCFIIHSCYRIISAYYFT